MKPITEVVVAIERRLQNTWHQSVAGDSSQWPYRFSLGRPDVQAVTNDFGRVQRWALDWTEWASGHNLDLDWGGRRSGSTHQDLPTHLMVPDADAAARTVGHGWPQRLSLGRVRHRVLAAEFSQAPLPTLVRAVDGWQQSDFDLLLVAARWFQNNPVSRLSPRQVPIEGLHSKWLNTHRPQVAALAGLDDLGLVEPRTTAIEFTYLDPAHRAAGGRLHDSVVPDTPMRPAYLPQTVIITENKDSAILFPELPDAIAVQGGGKSGPALVSRVGWIREAPRLVYWGDLDADGFEIVNSYRRNEVPVETILMDLATLAQYKRFESAFDAKTQPLRRSPRKPLPHLTQPEMDAYAAVTNPGGEWPVRIEQERIPLQAALDEIHAIVGRYPSD